MDKRSGWSFEEDPMEEMEDLAEASIENLAQHFFDSYERENAAFRRSSGLKVIVIREELGDCCSWCADLAGVYEYGSEPKDVWARHANCRCMVVTKTERGTYQDAWSRREFQTQREARIAREEEIAAEHGAEVVPSDVGEDVTKEYLQNASSREGRFIKEKGFVDQNGEEACAEWLYSVFGGDITLREDSRTDNVLSPDFLWRGKLWDLKSPKSKNKSPINKRIKHGLEQIKSNPGGLIIDYSRTPLTWRESISMTERIMRDRKIKEIDLIIRNRDRFIVIRAK